jgi:hypothetical protein
MSFSRARQILSGLKNTFTDIPLDAMAADGIPSSATVLYGTDSGRGLWKEPVFVDPPSPSFDNSALSAPQASVASGTPFSWFSGGGTSGAYGIVKLECGNSVMDLTADVEVTWGGRPMTRKGGVYNDNNSTFGWLMVFVLDGIPDGNQLIQVTPTQAGKIFSGYGSSYSYTNISSVGGLLTAYGTGAPSLAIPAENSNDIVWGAVCTGHDAMTSPLPSMTARQHVTGSGFNFYAGDAVGSATVSATSSATAWSAVGLDLIAAVAGSPLGSVEPVAVKTANYTASAGQMVPCNAASAPFTVTLPTAPSDGQNVVIKKIDASGNAVTFACGGSDVLNVASGPTTGTLTLQYQAVRLQYYAASGIWYVISTDAPLGQLDLRYEPLEQFAVLTSAYTLTSQTAAQQLLNTTPNGAVTLPVGEYFFECAFSLTGMSATSGSYGFGFGGTAVITQDWVATVTKASLGLIGGSGVVSWATANQTSLITANTATSGVALIKGRINVTAAGTLIPQVSLTQAAAAVVGAGAFFRIQSVGTPAYSGAWS